MTTSLKFYWNGIKANDGKLQRAHYSIGGYTRESGLSEDTITIYNKE